METRPPPQIYCFRVVDFYLIRLLSLNPSAWPLAASQKLFSFNRFLHRALSDLLRKARAASEWSVRRFVLPEWCLWEKLFFFSWRLVEGRDTDNATGIISHLVVKSHRLLTIIKTVFQGMIYYWQSGMQMQRSLALLSTFCFSLDISRTNNHKLHKISQSYFFSLSESWIYEMCIQKKLLCLNVPLFLTLLTRPIMYQISSDGAEGAHLTSIWSSVGQTHPSDNPKWQLRHWHHA